MGDELTSGSKSRILKQNEEVFEYWEKSIPMTFHDIPEMSFEEKRRFRYQLQDYMHEAFKFERFKEKSVLEIGCGAGIDSIEFARYGADVTAIDPTEKAVETTKQHFAEAGVTGEVIRASADDIPVPDNHFDCVYSFGVLHHIPNLEPVLNEIQRVLKPDGRLLAMVYNQDSLLYAYSILYLHGIEKGELKNHTPDELVSIYSERNEGCPYTKAYTKETAEETFGSILEDIETSIYYDAIDTKEKRKVKVEIPGRNDLGWHIVVEGKNLKTEGTS